MNLRAIITLLRLLMKDRKLLWKFVGPVLIDFAKEVSDELIVAATQIADEIASIDGLTSTEARAIAVQRLEALKAEEIGNGMTDEVFDFLLAFVIKRVKPVYVPPSVLTPAADIVRVAEPEKNK